MQIKSSVSKGIMEIKTNLREKVWIASLEKTHLQTEVSIFGCYECHLSKGVDEFSLSELIASSVFFIRREDWAGIERRRKHN